MYKELKDKWGWNEEPSPQQFAQTHTAAKQQREAQEAAQQRQLQEQARAAQANMQMQQGFEDFRSQSMHPPPQPVHPSPAASQSSGGGGGGMRKMPQGILNPMYAKADFNLPQHPYQNFYVAPNHVGGGTWGTQQLFYNM